eukprot:m.548600 g.548600  ORF g.548600 m.548600 type:complete len:161 (+) comp57717_c0_seq4:1897-2379(+)
MPIHWMAPESFLDNVTTSASDVWSFGVLAWEVMAYGADPYSDMKVQAAVQAIVSGYRLPRPQDCPVEFYDLLLRCWQKKADSRPKFKALTYLINGLADDESSLRKSAGSIPCGCAERDDNKQKRRSRLFFALTYLHRSLAGVWESIPGKSVNDCFYHIHF